MTTASDSPEPNLPSTEAMSAHVRKTRCIVTREELEALPNYSTVIDDDGDPWQKRGPMWFGTDHGNAAASAELDERFGPLIVVYRPDRDVIGEAVAHAARESWASAVQILVSVGEWLDGSDDATSRPAGPEDDECIQGDAGSAEAVAQGAARSATWADLARAAAGDRQED